MEDSITGLEFFAVIGFVVFVWGCAWIGYRLERLVRQDKSRKDKDEVAGLTMGDSVGAWIFGIVALVVALMIRFKLSPRSH